MRESLPGAVRSVNWGAIAVLITIATMLAGLVAQWTEMREAKRNAEARDIEQNARLERAESQVRALETDRAIERQLAGLSERLAAVEVGLKTLSQDVRERR